MKRECLFCGRKIAIKFTFSYRPQLRICKRCEAIELPLSHCKEYDAAAEWCAKRGLTGNMGDKLPENMDSQGALKYINADPEAFQKRVKDFAYALEMEKKTNKTK